MGQRQLRLRFLLFTLKQLMIKQVNKFFLSFELWSCSHFTEASEAMRNKMLTYVLLRPRARAIIEEGFIKKTRRRSSHRIGGQNPCPLVVLPRSFLNKHMSSTIPLAGLAVLPRSFFNKRMNSTIFFQKDPDKTAAQQGFCPPIRCYDLRLVF